MAKSVYLSPSTQQNNIGVGSYGTEETRCNQVADTVETELKRHGVTVYRNSPSMTLAQAVTDSNSKKADLHQAIHTNAYDGESRGCESFCWKKNNTTGHVLATNVYNEISAITPTTDRGVKEGYNYYGTGKHMYEVYQTSQPACLVEIIFHDNLEDVTWFLKNIENCGIAIAKGILKTLGITYINNSCNCDCSDVEDELTALTKRVKSLEEFNSNLVETLKSLTE